MSKPGADYTHTTTQKPGKKREDFSITNRTVLGSGSRLHTAWEESRCVLSEFLIKNTDQYTRYHHQIWRKQC